MRVDLKELLDVFGDEYERIYEADGRGEEVVGYHEMLAFGDMLIDEREDLVVPFVRYRQDVLSSDREVAAFGFAVDKLYC